jgi:hypothetical protein
MSKKVLFVCFGNSCRSPMAEILFNHNCERLGLPHQAISRGLDPRYKISEHAKDVSCLLFFFCFFHFLFLFIGSHNRIIAHHGKNWKGSF